MMLYPSMGELSARVPNRYMLVNVVARRARQIAQTYENAHQPLEIKPVTLAIQEVAQGEMDFSPEGLRKAFGEGEMDNALLLSEDPVARTFGSAAAGAASSRQSQKSALRASADRDPEQEDADAYTEDTEDTEDTEGTAAEAVEAADSGDGETADEAAETLEAAEAVGAETVNGTAETVESAEAVSAENAAEEAVEEPAV